MCIGKSHWWPRHSWIILASPHQTECESMKPPDLPSVHTLAEVTSESFQVVSNSLQPHGLYSPWNYPGQNTGVGNCSLLQGIFPTQGSNAGLPHCRRILYQLSHKRSPTIKIKGIQRAKPNWGTLMSKPGFFNKYIEGIKSVVRGNPQIKTSQINFQQNTSMFCLNTVSNRREIRTFMKLRKVWKLIRYLMI